MMRFVRVLAAAAIGAVALITPAGAQSPASSPSADPRVGLKAGLRDAEVAARGLELLANVPKPDGFFDPKAPAGEPNPRMPEEGEDKADATKGGAKQAETKKAAAKKADAKKADATPKTPPKPWGGLNFANSDLAFSGNHLFIGNFSGFNIYDVTNPASPLLLTSVVCPGGQGDVSVHGNLLFMSVEQTRGRLDCGVGGVEDPVSRERFRGVRIFDISDIRTPKQVAAVQTCRGSHTHTLVTDPKDTANVYIYGSGTAGARSAEELAGCSGKDPKEDPETALFSIDVIKVPVASPQDATIVARPRIFADETGNIAGLWAGGDHGPGTQKTAVTNQCHDITVFPEVGLAAGACSGNGILLDIADPANPKRIDHVADANFAYWHSATFNNDGTKVVFTDEWGGGMRPRCQATDQANWGANAIFDIVDRKLVFKSYYKLPAPQTATENCVAHNGSLLPVPGRDLMVQAWYQGGISVMDFTDSAHPTEVAFFDRGPLDAVNLITGGYWSAYWYNGHVFGSEMSRGLDVFRILPTEALTQNEIDAAARVHATAFNVQHQDKVTWPADRVVALAYVDQLVRAGAVPSDRVDMLRGAVTSGDTGQLAMIASRIGERAATVSGPDASRMKALAAVLASIK